MAGRAHSTGVNTNVAIQKATPKTTFTMQRLWRQGAWGAAAAAALLIAILTSRSDLLTQKIANLQTAVQTASPARDRVRDQPARQLEAENATRQLAETVRDLSDDRDRIMTRLAAVERNIDDVTGSITREIEAAKDTTAEALASWPSSERSVPMTNAAIASMVASGVPLPAVVASPPPPNSLTPAPAELQPAAATSALPMAYGADLGNASSIKALRARWTQIRSAHPEIFEGLSPVVRLRDNPRSNRIEFRLVVGPLASAARAAQLCASLPASRLSCKPTMFEGRQVALH